VRRWVCPNGCPGVLAPDKPRTDDVRRYCLPCSAKTGRLVKRTSPALDKQRATRTAARTARVAQQRTRESERAKAKRSRGGEDLDAWARKFWRLPVFKEQRRWSKTLPKITYREKTYGYSGHTKTWAKEIVVSLSKNLDPARAVEIILHELVHAVLPPSEWHGKKFRSTIMAAATEAFPGIKFRFADSDGVSMYELDERIADGIREHLARKEVAA